jgi:hypothetical protein
MQFGLVFEDIFMSSLMSEQLHVRWAWVSFIVSRDKHGEVYGTTSRLAQKFGLTIEQMEDALQVLSSPDPDSTSEAEEGRRIISYGSNRWGVVNHEYYQSLEQLEKKRAQSRATSEKYRKTKGGDSARVTGDIPSVSVSTSVASVSKEEEWECEGEKKPATTPAMARFDTWWNSYPHAWEENKAPAQAEWLKLNAACQKACIEAVPRYLTYLQRQGWGNTRYVQKASNWLKNKGWDKAWTAPEKPPQDGGFRGRGQRDPDFKPKF